MIAAMTLRFLDPFGTGKLVLFQVTYDKVRESLCYILNASLTNPMSRIGTPMNLSLFFYWVSLGAYMVHISQS
jgi:hypothetical protein